MKKKGFTLIELLAVIIILAVIALIATPIVLNVVENAKKQANKNSVYGIIDSAKLYYAESLLDSSKTSSINGTTNLIDEIKVSGNKPDSGELYINNKGQTAIAVVYDNVCYKKNFTDNNLTESEDITNCSSTPQASYKCKRAEILHQEECIQNYNSGYCKKEGYTLTGLKGTNIVTYGNDPLTRETGVLESGDAFDCDVNGDGVYDPETERFYYVSDLYNTTTNAFNNKYAVLIYYNNTNNGIPSVLGDDGIAYGLKQNIYGPENTISYLPTTVQWPNVSLSNEIRAIITETGLTVSPHYGDIVSNFSYSGYSSRLLTVQELNSGCNITVGSKEEGELSMCNYVLENTNYSDERIVTLGYWLETVNVESSYGVWHTMGFDANVIQTDSINDHFFGTRPVIEVLKTDIEY